MRYRGKRFDNWDVAAIAGGIAIGVLGSRLLPPVIANARGAMRAKSGDPFQKLLRDHRVIEATLQDMANASDQSGAQRIKLLLLFKRRLAKHTMAEEDVVYPVLHDMAGQADRARQLYDEHAQMKIHLYGLENALTSPGDWRDRVRRLEDVIRPHIRDEEDVQFPRLRQMLQEKQRMKLGGEILREEALVL